MMVSIEHVSSGWRYTFGNGVAGDVASVTVSHDGMIAIVYTDGLTKVVAP